MKSLRGRPQCHLKAYTHFDSLSLETWPLTMVVGPWGQRVKVGGMLPDSFSIRHLCGVCPLGIAAGTNEKGGQLFWLMYLASICEIFSDKEFLRRDRSRQKVSASQGD